MGGGMKKTVYAIIQDFIIEEMGLRVRALP